MVCPLHSSRSPDAHFRQVAGESGLGKTTFINTLFSTTIKNYADHKRRHAKQVDKTVEIEITKAELEEKFFKGAQSKPTLSMTVI
jgi:cell division control protein 12